MVHMKNKLHELLTPTFIIGYTALIAVIIALFVYVENKDIANAIIMILTNVLTGVVTYFYTRDKGTDLDKQVDELLKKERENK